MISKDMMMLYNTTTKPYAINPTYVDAIDNKANALSNLQKYDEAIQYYDKVLAIDPTNVDSLNNKGAALQKLQKYDEAIQYYDKALAIDP